MSCVWYLVLLVLQTRYTAVSSITWPHGKYTLLKPRTGCPEGWKYNGFLFQDTMDANLSNNRSEILHIEGIVAPSYVVRSFCIKIKRAGRQDWSKGQYCIYKHLERSLLHGMRSGWIQMYDEENDNKDAAKYTYKLVTLEWSQVYYFYAKLNFYCNTKGNKKTPIELPISKPFYLLPYGSSECQQVKWMVATIEWIKYHTRNYQGYHQKNGTVPYYKLGDSENKGITMYYCYYESCNYTLTEKKGVFQSPGFPRKYPDGQLCSWRIMVPANHTIYVQFTNFSLYGNDGNDTLKYSKKINDSFGSYYKLKGDMGPFTLTAESDIEFVFRSDEAKTSYGFKAKYKILVPQETTLTKPATVSTIDTTTYTISTKKTSTTTIPPNNITTITKDPNLPTKSKSGRSSGETFKDSRYKDQNRTKMIVIVIVAVCFMTVVVILIVIIYTYRIKVCERTAGNSNRTDDRTVMNPTYDRGSILLNQPTGATTTNPTADTNNGTQMYQPLTRDIHEYEAIDYEKLNKATLNIKLGYSKNKTSESTDANPVYHVLEGPDPNNGPCERRTYDDVDKEDKCTFNPLYEPSPRNINPIISDGKEFQADDKNGADPVYYVLERPDLSMDQPRTEPKRC